MNMASYQIVKQESRFCFDQVDAFQMSSLENTDLSKREEDAQMG